MYIINTIIEHKLTDQHLFAHKKDAIATYNALEKSPKKNGEIYVFVGCEIVNLML